MNKTRVLTDDRDESIARFMSGVYAWMTVGLVLTGGIAYMFGTTDLARQLVQNKSLLIGLLLGEIALVFAISALINRIGSVMAGMMFLVYSAMNGVTLSTIFLAYTKASITSTFFICAGTFAACSVYGWATKKDLTSMGGFMSMGLIGLIIAMIVNIFLQSPAIDFTVSAIGVIVFVGLTAYDTQKLKEIGGYGDYLLDKRMMTNTAIMGALMLYLDFINLMLFFLRFFGVSTPRD